MTDEQDDPSALPGLVVPAQQRRHRRRALLALLVYAPIPVALTLSPDAPREELLQFHAVLQRALNALAAGRLDITTADAEALGNLLLFVPLGFLLHFLLPRMPLLALLGLALLGSVAVEAFQQLALETRSPTLRDVLHNTSGAAVGLVLASDLRRRARRPEDQPER